LTLGPFSKSFENPTLSPVCEPRHEEIVIKLASDIGIWEIVAHIEFKF